MPVIMSIIRDAKAFGFLRSKLIEDLPARKSSAKAHLELLSTIARDAKEDKEVREAAVNALAQMGDEGWAVLDGLKQDKDVGEKVREKLEAHDKARKK